MASWWSEVTYLMGGGTSSIIATPPQLNRDPFNISRAQANLSFNSTLLKRWMCPSPSSIFLFMQASCSLLFMVIGPKVCSHCIVLYYFWNNKRLWRSHVMHSSSVGWSLSHVFAEVICRISFMHLLFLVKSILIEGLVLIGRSEWSSFFALLINLCSRFGICMLICLWVCSSCL